MDQSWISLPVAASRLGWSWPKCYNAVLSQRLDARQSENGRWLVSEASVDRVLRAREGAQVAQAS